MHIRWNIGVIRATGATRTWYTADALGSVRATLSDTGVVGGAAFYDPYGQIQSGTPGSFGFTGELQQGSNVYLRARWYNAANGGFTARDPFEGMSETPYSLHSYAYGYSNPVGNTDPSGLCPTEYTDGEDSYDCMIAKTRLEGLNIIIRDYDQGRWSVTELQTFYQATQDLIAKAGWNDTVFRDHIGLVHAEQSNDWLGKAFVGTPASALTYPGDRAGSASKIVFFQSSIYLNQANLGKLLSAADIAWFKYTAVHELAHAWDFASHGNASLGMMDATRSYYFCIFWYVAVGTTTKYGKGNHAEDWAEAVANAVYHPENIDDARKVYVHTMMKSDI